MWDTGVRVLARAMPIALGLVLFVVTLCLNIVGIAVVRKYREQYD